MVTSTRALVLFGLVLALLTPAAATQRGRGDARPAPRRSTPVRSTPAPRRTVQPRTVRPSPRIDTRRSTPTPRVRDVRRSTPSPTRTVPRSVRRIDTRSTPTPDIRTRIRRTPDVYRRDRTPTPSRRTYDAPDTRTREVPGRFDAPSRRAGDTILRSPSSPGRGGDLGTSGTGAGRFRSGGDTSGADAEAVPTRPRVRIDTRAWTGLGSRDRDSRSDTRGRVSLRDLYRRVPERTGDRSPGASRRFRDSLADRYREQLRRNVHRSGSGDRRTAPDRPSAGRNAPDRLGPSADRNRRREGDGGAAGLRDARDGRADIAVSGREYVPAGADRRTERRIADVPADAKLAPRTPTLHRTAVDRRPARVNDLRSDRLRPRRRPPPSYPYVPGGSRSFYYGGASWYGSYLSLSFSFGYAPSWCAWGLYSYPYYYACYWPRWYWCYRRSFCFSWNARYAWSSPYYWWWPSTCYRPSVYVSYYGYGNPYATGYEAGRYYRSAYGGGSVTIVEDEPIVVEGEEVIVAGGGAAEGPPASSRTRLAERHVSLGDFYFKEGRFSEAAESYLRALAYAPEDASLHFVLADALFAVGDYHYAAFMIEKALRLEPELALSRADKREFYADPEEFDEQLEVLSSYVADKPYDAAAHLVLGYNLKFSEQPDAARDAFRRVLEIDPDNEAARLFLDALEER